MTGEPAVYLISGPMAAGKSTVARLLAQRFERGVHLEGDLFRRSIVSGRLEMTPAALPGALEQLRLRYRLAAAAADAYFEAGFAVALEDVAAGPLLGEYRTMIRSRPCHVVVLLPSPEALAVRAAGRDDRGYGAWTIERLYEGFAAGTPRVGIWLDTSELSADEPGSPRHHLYVVVAGSEPHAAHVRFRDYLREHADAAEEYAALKRSLARRHRDEGLAYTEAKNEFVGRVLRAAR